MMPAWEEVAKNLKGSKVHVAKIDLTKHPGEMQSFVYIHMILSTGISV